MPDSSAVLADAPAAIEGAVVFTDIVGFTEFTAVQGDGAANALLSAQETIVDQELPSGARVVKELGDGLMLWFPEAQTALSTCLSCSSASSAIRERPCNHSGYGWGCTGAGRPCAAMI